MAPVVRPRSCRDRSTAITACANQGLRRKPGTRAKTDRIDAELIARFMAFRPDAGRILSHEKIRSVWILTSKRGQLIETLKSLLAQIKAQGKLGWADMFAAMDGELKGLLDRQIAEMEARIEETIASNDKLAATAGILRSVHGIGPVASTLLNAFVPQESHIRWSSQPSPGNSSQSRTHSANLARNGLLTPHEKYSC